MDTGSEGGCEAAFAQGLGEALAAASFATGSGRGSALPLQGRALGVALSGGGDSVALLLLMRDWACGVGVRLEAATVDHRLRPGSEAEARDCAALCAQLGVRHEVLVWTRPDGVLPAGNLQQSAREARRSLLAAWAQRRGLAAVVLGHTLDDQAETVLLRLARGSGVDGLAAMAPASRAEGLFWLRPLLGLRRAALRDLCRAQGVGWVDDPGNRDPRFARARARALSDALAEIGGPGLAPEGLVRLARHMAAARMVLESEADRAVAEVLRIEGADVIIDAAGLFALGDDTRDRLMARIISRLGGGAGLRPRHDALRRLLAGLAIGRGGTLGGCRFLPQRDAHAGGAVAGCGRGSASFGTIRALRETRAAVAAPAVAPGQDWDGRWRIEPLGGAVPGLLPEPVPGAAPDGSPEAFTGAIPGATQGPPPRTMAQAPVPTGGLVTRALGPRGLALCPDAPRGCVARASLAAGPALWRGDTLIAAPLAGFGGGWRAIPLVLPVDFVAGAIAH